MAVKTRVHSSTLSGFLSGGEGGRERGREGERERGREEVSGREWGGELHVYVSCPVLPLSKGRRQRRRAMNM